MELSIDIERHDPTPAYRQIADGIRDLVRDGALQPGDRLPTTRELATRLAVNRSTVVAAYRALVEDGTVDATVGRGTFISSGREAAAEPAAGAAAAATTGSAAITAYPDQPGLSRAIESAARHATHETERIFDHPEPVDFAALAPDETLFPIGEFEELVTRLLRERGRELLQYGPPQGDPDLRALIADDLRSHGMRVDTDDVVIVNGIQQGIDLTLRVFIDPGDMVVVESPTYVSVLPSLGLYRAEIAPVPMTPRGIDVEHLEQLAARRQPKLVYSMPNFQNPTGVTMDLDSRHRLVEIAARHGICILEDDYERDLRLHGHGLPSLMALDGAGRVIHMGTFSKGLFPGLRIGWIAAPRPLVEHYNLAKRISDLHTGSLLQAAVAAFLTGGHYQRHSDKLQRIYRQRQSTLLAAMQRELPRGVGWTRPEGGFVIWLDLPAPLDARDIVREARVEGVAATPGSYFFHGRQGDDHLRLSIARANEAAIERGIRVLGAIMHRRLAERPEAATDEQRSSRTLPQL
jgi:DNA-binding transcriptional MocR family regulator